jgi:hypothetical protein
MNAQSLPLEPIHLGPEISWWPLAPGWIVLALITVSLLAFIVWRLISRYQQQAPKRAAIALLHRINADYLAHQDTAKYIQESSQTIKRFILSQYPRAQVAGLFGKYLTDFMVEHTQSEVQKQQVLKYIVGLFGDIKYQKNLPTNIQIHSILVDWIQQFPVEKVARQQMEIPHARV